LNFAFVTGVSKFSRTTTFSRSNVFKDISESEEYASNCGITLDELGKRLGLTLKKIFAEGLFKGTLFRDYESLKQVFVDMSDGYSWNSTDRIFNPLSLLKALKNRGLNPNCSDRRPHLFVQIHQIRACHLLEFG
jgi:hypothetical protein